MAQNQITSAVKKEARRRWLAGDDVKDIAEDLSTTATTIRNWAERYDWALAKKEGPDDDPYNMLLDNTTWWNRLTLEIGDGIPNDKQNKQLDSLQRRILELRKHENDADTRNRFAHIFVSWIAEEEPDLYQAIKDPLERALQKYVQETIREEREQYG